MLTVIIPKEDHLYETLRLRRTESDSYGRDWRAIGNRERCTLFWGFSDLQRNSGNKKKCYRNLKKHNDTQSYTPIKSHSVRIISAES